MPRAQHVGQLAHLLGVGDGLVEGLGEVVADQNGQVGVVALFLLEAVAVDHCQVVVVVFLGHKAAGILAEGAHLVAPGCRVADEFAFIENLVDGFHDFVAAFHPHADVHGAGFVGDVVFGTDLFQPVGAAAAGGNDHLLAEHLPGAVLLPQAHALADGAFQDDVLALGFKQHFHAGFQQVILDVQVELLGFLGAQVADGAIHQLQARLDGTLADILDLLAFIDALHLGVGTEFQIDLVGVVDEFLGKILADEVGQLAAHLVTQGQFAVGKSARAGKSGGDGTGRLAVDADAGLVFGAVAFFHRLALFHQQDLVGLVAFAQQFQGGEDAGRAGAYDNQVIHGSGVSLLK